MELIGKQVTHKTFGNGIIKDISGSLIFILFENEDVARKLAYPSSLDKFIEFKDQTFAEEVKKQRLQIQKDEAEKREHLQFEENANYVKRALRQEIESAVKSVPSYCDQSHFAIVNEIGYLRKNGGKKYKVYDGELIEVKNKSYIYSFETDSELFIPEGSQITIRSDDSREYANIISCEDFILVISTYTDYGEKVSELEFSAEPWQLLEALCERLADIKANPSRIVKSLICDGFNEVVKGKTINKGQSQAKELASVQPITFIWGPPGTGKTTTLADVTIEHLNKGNRVLMLSYSNVSVDGATLRVYEKEKNSPQHIPGRLVRYGYPRNKDLRQHSYLTSYNLALYNSPDLIEKRDRLYEERKKHGRSSSEYTKLGKQLSDIRSLLSDKEKESVYTAKFVATTVSKATVDKSLYTQMFDVVIFDEASMAYSTQIIFAASLASKHFICLGDFNQLPPIVQGDKKSILKTDIFKYCGIHTAVEHNLSHNWLCLLDTQYRMHPEISDYVNKYMYHNLLVTGEKIIDERKRLAENSPLPNFALGIADLTGMMSVCSTTNDKSRINVLSAFLSFDLALRAAVSYDVGIITPYNAQSRLIHAMSRDSDEAKEGLKHIASATVHQFQGSEKDIIIYDAVDCYRMPYPGTLLTSKDNNYANRLFNVAVTRAKGKFIAVANVTYMNKSNISKSMLFGRLLSDANRRIVLGHEKYNQRSHDKSFFQYYENSIDTEAVFINDINNAKNDVRVDIPGRVETSNEFLDVLCKSVDDAKSRGALIYIRAEKRKNLPKQLQKYVIENPFVWNPITVIDRRISWFGVPFSDANFIVSDNEVESLYRPIFRFAGRFTARALYGFLKMNDTIDKAKNGDIESSERCVGFANHVSKNIFCEKCEAFMKLAKNRGGKFYLSCSKCRNPQYIDPVFVNNYMNKHMKNLIKCPQCGFSLEAKLGRYGIFLQCCGQSKHMHSLDTI